MYQLKPMITTFEAALSYIERFGRPKLYYFNSVIESIVLCGGSIRHHITISLITSHKVAKDFGNYHYQEDMRLVINDAGYRTKYWIDENEYDELLSKIRKFTEERGLKLKVIYQFCTEKAIFERIKQLGFSKFEMKKENLKNNDINKKCDKIELELEKLKLIAEHYDIPLAAFFMTTDELKESKAREREAIKERTTRKLKLLKEIIWGVDDK